MCYLYTSHTPAQELARQFRLNLDRPLPNFAPSWKVAPTDPAPVVRRHPETGERRLDVLNWGLVPHWAKDLKSARRPANARSETVASNPLFRQAYQSRRCLVPLNEWYEWTPTSQGKQAHALTRQDGQPAAFAGLWEGVRWPNGEILRTFAILTTEPNAEARQVHNRMPLVLTGADWPLWLGETEGDPATLLHPAPDNTCRIWPIRSPLGKGRPNARELLDPL